MIFAYQPLEEFISKLGNTFVNVVSNWDSEAGVRFEMMPERILSTKGKGNRVLDMFTRVLLAGAVVPLIMISNGQPAWGFSQGNRNVAESESVGSADGQTREPKIPTYFIDGGPKSTGDEYAKLKSLKFAIKMGNLVEAKELLSTLQASPRPKIILEVVKIRLNRDGLFHDPQVGVSLIHKMVADNASHKGDAAYRAGLYFQSAHADFEKKLAINWFEKAAQWGVDHAHVRLGDLHSKNAAPLRDLVKALKHYEKAAETVSAAPIMSFARRILSLNSDQEDCGIDPYRLASRYIPALKAEAASGKLMAAKELGRLYLKGAFVEPDIVEARKWLHFAAQAGDPGAIYDLARIDLKSPKRSTAIGNATKLLSLAASSGNAGAYLSLAKLYLIKNSPETDREAFKLIQKAVDAGSQSAVAALKNIYQGEKILGQNPARIGQLYAAIQTIEASIRNVTAVAGNVASPNLTLAEAANSEIDPIVSGSINAGEIENTIASSLSSAGVGSCVLPGY